MNDTIIIAALVLAATFVIVYGVLTLLLARIIHQARQEYYQSLKDYKRPNLLEIYAQSERKGE